MQRVEALKTKSYLYVVIALDVICSQKGMNLRDFQDHNRSHYFIFERYALKCPKSRAKST
jgi:hypothetical protein